MLFLKLILYFLLAGSGFPSLNHLVFSSGVPVTVYSKIAGSPAVTWTISAFSVILAGSTTELNNWC